MKKYMIALLMMMMSVTVFCQQGRKIESLKIGFLTNKLNLDARTAEKFWPVYHQYEDELLAVVRERRMNQNETRNAEEILDQEQKALDIKRKYTAMFARIITPDQLNQLYAAEKEFRQMIINRSQKREFRQQSAQEMNGAPYRNNGQRKDARPLRMDNQPQRMEARPQMPPSQPVRQTRPQPVPANATESKRDRMRR
ncbi:MAG: hypothetical protein IT257_11940 [Chitinophagaceae bacterium]|nr:hypothetical protein [Chitinophagaceae bacterium]